MIKHYPIDEACPNARLHPRGEGGNLHALTNHKLCELIRQQLARTMNYDIEDLGLRGARGMVLKLLLASHGYTFIGKATIDFYIPELTHEERVYHPLLPFKVFQHGQPVHRQSLRFSTRLLLLTFRSSFLSIPLFSKGRS